MSQKTNKSIAKRFKQTGSGKLVRRKANHRHLLRNKNAKQKRAMRQDHVVPKCVEKQMRVGLPHN